MHYRANKKKILFSDIFQDNGTIKRLIITSGNSDFVEFLYKYIREIQILSFINIQHHFFILPKIFDYKVENFNKQILKLCKEYSAYKYEDFLKMNINVFVEILNSHALLIDEEIKNSKKSK